MSVGARVLWRREGRPSLSHTDLRQRAGWVRARLAVLIVTEVRRVCQTREHGKVSRATELAWSRIRVFGMALDACASVRTLSVQSNLSHGVA